MREVIPRVVYELEHILKLGHALSCIEQSDDIGYAILPVLVIDDLLNIIQPEIASGLFKHFQKLLFNFPLPRDDLLFILVFHFLDKYKMGMVRQNFVQIVGQLRGYYL